MHSFELIHVVWRKYVAKMKIISDIYFSLVEILINMDMFLTQERDFFPFKESPDLNITSTCSRVRDFFHFKESPYLDINFRVRST